jgi:sRNA-binding carbon storage regulator CsrA
MKTEKTSRILVELKTGESLKIGDTVLVLVDKSGKRARLDIHAPESVKVENSGARKHPA